LSQFGIEYDLAVFQVSQGNAATDLRSDEDFNKFLFRNSLLYIAVIKLRKSVNICLSYRKNKSVSFFMAHGVDFFVGAFIHALLSRAYVPYR